MKKYLRKAIAAVAAATMIFSTGFSAVASTFPDVTEENHAWAIEAIESMAESGIIKGYDGGIFKPDQDVSKLESLVLVSRILGFDIEENANLVSESWDIYCEEVDKFDLLFGEKEIAYLLMKGVIEVDELENYIGEANRNDALQRYEVAVLLTKALDAVKFATNDLISELKFADTSTFPPDAKKYIAYITSIGLMQGVGENNFAPSMAVTRAQAAVVLYKMQNMMSYTYDRGVISSINHTTRALELQKDNGEVIAIKASSGTNIRYNGEIIGSNDIQVGFDVVVTYKDGDVYSLDCTDALIDDVVYGSYSSSANSTLKGKTITINILEDSDTDVDTSKKTEFKVSDDAIITFNDSVCTLSTFKSGYYVKLTVVDGVATIVEATTKDSKLSGRVNEIIIDPVFMLKIEDNEGNIQDYLMSSNVSVKKNGVAATAKDILEGDSVSANLAYGRISSISATSKTSKKSGVIREVIISVTPRITISVNNEEITYALSSESEVTIGKEVATFYDLRVGMPVDIVLESDTVTSLNSTVSNTITTLEGTVTFINASARYLKISYFDAQTGEELDAFVAIKENASIVDYATQKDKKISNIVVGNKVSVTGAWSAMFEAGTVVIIG